MQADIVFTDYSYLKVMSFLSSFLSLDFLVTG